MDIVLEASGAAVEAIAPAKINLALHVTGRRSDGYHLLDSLVVFAGEGDRLRFAPAAADALSVSGPFAAGLPVDDRNIARRALGLVRAVAEAAGAAFPPLAVWLEKHLPLAAGLGGGSADAAAVLRFAADRLPRLAKDLRAASLGLGADVPMCFDGVPARVSGIGEVGQPIRRSPALPIVLVNPGCHVATPAVFAALERRANPPMQDLPPGGFATVDDVLEYLQGCRNDLAEPARRLAPAIVEAEDALRDAGAALVRMSGSGATVFGLFRSPDETHGAAGAIARRRPDWWVRATVAASVASGDPE